MYVGPNGDSGGWKTIARIDLRDNCQKTVFPPLPPGSPPLLAHFCNVTVGEARARFFLLAQVEEAKEAAIPTLPTVPQSHLQDPTLAKNPSVSALKDSGNCRYHLTSVL